MNATGWLFDAMVNVEQILPADVILNFSVSYMPNSMTLQSRTSGIWNSMLSVSKSFCDNCLNVSLTGTTNIKCILKGKTHLIPSKSEGPRAFS